MEAVEKISAVQLVEDRLYHYITEGDVEVGQKLPTEKRLCEDLGVGRGTIREAIRLLQARGFVEIRPGRGSFVLQKHETQKEDIVSWFNTNGCAVKDLIDIRTAIEPLAVKLAIQRCTDEDIAALKTIHDESVAAAEVKDTATLARCDEQFHSLICSFSRNVPLMDICKRINSGLTAFRSKTFYIPRNVYNLIPAHEAILEAFLKRDVELGQSSMQMHLALVASDLEMSKQI